MADLIMNRDAIIVNERKEYSKPQTGRYHRGIGSSMFFHGAGFTRKRRARPIKAVTHLHKFPNGDVEILVSNSDIGHHRLGNLIMVTALMWSRSHSSRGKNIDEPIPRRHPYLVCVFGNISLIWHDNRISIHNG